MPGLILVILHRFNKDNFHYDPNDTEPSYDYFMPMGLPYISAALKKAGHSVDVLNLNHHQGLVRDLVAEKLKTGYEFVFLGGVSLHYPNIRDIVQCIREISPQTKIVIGGGMASAQPVTMMKLLKPDCIIVGEGEEAAVTASKQTSEYPTIWESETPIRDLDALPYPDYDAFGFREFLNNQKPTFIYDGMPSPRPYPTLASRSCPNACTFCYHTLGNQYRQRSIKSVMEEIRYATFKYHINFFFFYDEMFAGNKARVLDFCREFKAFRETVPWEVTFSPDMRVDHIDAEVAAALKQSGCDPVCMGIESMSQTVLDSMKKHITPAGIQSALEILKAENLAPVGNFIFGDSAETLDTAEETLTFFRQRQDLCRGIRCTFIIPFQGSEIYNRQGYNDAEFVADRAANGYDFHEPVNMTRLSEREFRKLKDMVFTAHYCEGTYSVPIGVGNGWVLVECPYCKKQTLYGIPPPPRFGLVNIGCHKCGSRFELVSRWYWLARVAIRMFGFMNLYDMKKKIGV